MDISLDGRLMSCANYVRAGAVFADIGTDHGYLPVFLLTAGRIGRAYLADINAQPLDSARENVAAAGLCDLCEFVLTDGAAALHGFGITDYAIAGMGGTLIADIIEAADHLRDPGIRLILQPMTRQAHLRRYLASSGFTVLSETYSYADGKHYVTLCAHYSGEVRQLSEIEAELGTVVVHEADRVEFLGFLRMRHASLCRARDGKRLGGADTYAEDEIISGIEAVLCEYGAPV